MRVAYKPAVSPVATQIVPCRYSRFGDGCPDREYLMKCEAAAACRAETIRRGFTTSPDQRVLV